MDQLLQNELYLLVKQYIQPEMLILVPVLLFIGWMMKSTPKIPDWLIPYVLTLIGIIAGIAFTMHVVEGAIQGVLVSALSVLINNLYKQWNKKDMDQKKSKNHN